MKQYQSPELEFVMIESVDIITDSGDHLIEDWEEKLNSGASGNSLG